MFRGCCSCLGGMRDDELLSRTVIRSLIGRGEKHLGGKTSRWMIQEGREIGSLGEDKSSCGEQ